MGNFLAYCSISGLTMLFMYLAYKIFMARENQHGFNRVMLLLIYLVSFSAYPLYNFINKLSLIPNTTVALNVIEIENLTINPTPQPIWTTILIWTFLAGMLVVTGLTIITWIRIVYVIHFGQKIKKEGYTLVVIDNDKIASFSWMRYVVINRNDLDKNISAITTHELKHVLSFHWIDLLIAQIICVINWFNPAAWLMRDELMLVHEYQADISVLESGHNPQDYQILLVKKAVGTRFPSLANSINHSKLKKRITMMYKSKSSARRKMKAIALVPMVALALGLASEPTVKAAVYTISNSEVSLDEGNEKSQQSPQLKIVSLNNSGIETTIVIESKDFVSISVSGASLYNKGNVYNAKSLNTNMENGIASITAVFPFSGDYENTSIILNINGEDVNLDLAKFLKNAQSQSISVSKESGIVVTSVESYPKSIENYNIYLDGKEISKADMNALNPEDIASVTIVKNTIIITSKKQ